MTDKLSLLIRIFFENIILQIDPCDRICYAVVVMEDLSRMLFDDGLLKKVLIVLPVVVVLSYLNWLGL